jgi:hypothetical protein
MNMDSHSDAQIQIGYKLIFESYKFLMDYTWPDPYINSSTKDDWKRHADYNFFNYFKLEGDFIQKQFWQNSQWIEIKRF